MKTVIVQSLWGTGINMSANVGQMYLQPLHDHCIPSVRDYASRHGLSYILHRPTKLHFRFSIDEKLKIHQESLDKAIPLHSLLGDDQFNSFFEPFYVMNELSSLYERFIYLDLDIYIKPDAPAMPHTKGVWAVVEWQVPQIYHAKRGFSEVPQSHQFNSGVLVMDRKGVKSFYDYLRHVKPDPRCTGDQDYFRLWSLKNKVNRLDDVWNYLVAFHQNRDGHFVHYTKKEWIARELASTYLINWGRLYSALKSVERSIRRARLFQFFRRLWKQRVRA